MIPIKTARIGYDPLSADLTYPGDRRRFCFFAKSINLNYEIYNPSNEYDLVILTEGSDISHWRRIENGPKIIFNQNDSYLSEKLSVRSVFRGLGKYLSKQHQHLEINFPLALRGMCKRSDAVICCTTEQKNEISKSCKNTHILFDAHFQESTVRKDNYEAHKPFRLVWEGLPTNTYQLLKFSKLIAESDLKDKIELHVITDKYGYKFLNKFLKFDIQKYINKLAIKSYFHEWSIKTLQEVAMNSDLAIIPIDMKDPFTLGKPENKLLLFWRMGLPTIVSGTPSYISVMKGAKQNYFVKEEQDWINYIEELISSKDKRVKAAEGGLDYLNRKYSLDIFMKQWECILNSIGFSI